MQRSAIIYVRVSSPRQVENFSLGVQEDACRAYCRTQGWPVLRVFREEGESATRADRTQLKALLDYCCAHGRDIAAVVVHSVSRWSRDTRDHFNLKAVLSRWGIALRSVTEPIGVKSVKRMFPLLPPGTVTVTVAEVTFPPDGDADTESVPDSVIDGFSPIVAISAAIMLTRRCPSGCR